MGLFGNGILGLPSCFPLKCVGCIPMAQLGHLEQQGIHMLAFSCSARPFSHPFSARSIQMHLGYRRKWAIRGRGLAGGRGACRWRTLLAFIRAPSDHACLLVINCEVDPREAESLKGLTPTWKTRTPHFHKSWLPMVLGSSEKEVYRDSDSNPRIRGHYWGFWLHLPVMHVYPSLQQEQD